MSSSVLIPGGFDSSWASVQQTMEHRAFWPVRALDDDEQDWRLKIREAVSAVVSFVRTRDASIDKSIPVDDVNASQHASQSLEQILVRVCSRSKEVTCVVETSHLDDVHLDLTSGVYSRENFVASKLTVRVSIFTCNLTKQLFANYPGFYRPWETTLKESQKCQGDDSFLQEHFVGSVVVVPRRGGTLGRTLLDPRWLAPHDVSVRITSFEQTIRGKRLYVQAWPWRQQDGEALSCAETTLLGIACYFSNEFNDYPVTMPTKMIEEFERASDVRVTPSQGRSYNELGRVLTSIGFMPRRYDELSVSGPLVPGEQMNTLESLLRVARIYVSSGIPVAVNSQPPGMGFGHWITIIGSEESEKPSYDDFLHKAEHIVGQHDGKERNLFLLHEADLDAERGLVVSDDLSGAYEVRRWPHLTINGTQMPREIVVPMAKDMALGAESARKQAMRILRSVKAGIIARSKGMLGADEKLVLTQRLVGVRGYLRFRCATCAPALEDFYERGTFPRFLWLFECLRHDQFKRPHAEREACVELLLDATGQSAADASSRLILFRCPGYAHFHDSEGRGWDCEGEVPATFPAFDLSLRHISVVEEC